MKRSIWVAIGTLSLAIGCNDDESAESAVGTAVESAVFAVSGNAAGGGNFDGAFAVVSDSTGRILAVGRSHNSQGDQDMVLWRFRPDGTLDASFGKGGIVVHDNAAGGHGDDGGSYLVLDSQGRIVVTGWSDRDSQPGVRIPSMALWRFLPDGTPDPSFGTGGFVVHSNAAGGNGEDFGSAVVFDAGGRILVAGSSRSSNHDDDMAVWRFHANGTLDDSFGTNGVVTYNHPVGNGRDMGFSILVDPAGRILVGGTTTLNNRDLAIWRYLPDGTLDASFGAGGVVVHHDAAGGNAQDWGWGMVRDGKGKVLITGDSRNGAGDRDMVICRYYEDNGTLDPTFGNGGVVVHSNAAGGEGTDSGQGIALDPSGKIVVSGFSTRTNSPTPDRDMAVWRYLENGTLDSTFGTGGVVLSSNAAGRVGDDIGFLPYVDSAGAIWVAGISGASEGAGQDFDMVIWRFR